MPDFVHVGCFIGSPTFSPDVFQAVKYMLLYACIILLRRCFSQLENLYDSLHV